MPIQSDELVVSRQSCDSHLHPVSGGPPAGVSRSVRTRNQDQGGGEKTAASMQTRKDKNRVNGCRPH